MELSILCYFHIVHSSSLICHRSHHLYCHIDDTNCYLSSNFCFTFRPIRQSNPGLSSRYCPSSACLLFEVYNLPVFCLSSVKSVTQTLCGLCSSSFMSVMWCLFSMSPPVNKQFIPSHHLAGLCSFYSRTFYLLCLSCCIHHIHFSNPILPSRPTSCPAPIMSVIPNSSPSQVYHLPLNCHTCYFFLLSPLPLSAA